MFLEPQLFQTGRRANPGGEIEQPAARSISWSASVKARAKSLARRLPTALLPAPIRPISATVRFGPGRGAFERVPRRAPRKTRVSCGPHAILRHRSVARSQASSAFRAKPTKFQPFPPERPKPCETPFPSGAPRGEGFTVSYKNFGSWKFC